MSVHRPSSVLSDISPTLVFTAWPALHLKTVGILLHCILYVIVNNLLYCIKMCFIADIGCEVGKYIAYVCLVF